VNRHSDSGNAALGFAVAGPFVAFIVVLVINLAAAVWQREMVAHEAIRAIRQSTLTSDAVSADLRLADRLQSIGVGAAHVSHSDSILDSGGVVRSITVSFLPKVSLPIGTPRITIRVVGVVEP